MSNRIFSPDYTEHEGQGFLETLSFYIVHIHWTKTQWLWFVNYFHMHYHNKAYTDGFRNGIYAMINLTTL